MRTDVSVIFDPGAPGTAHGPRRALPKVTQVALAEMVGTTASASTCWPARGASCVTDVTEIPRWVRLRSVLIRRVAVDRRPAAERCGATAQPGHHGKRL